MMGPFSLERVRLGLQHHGVLCLERVSRRFGTLRKPAHLRVGERGEMEALFYLRGLGYVVVARRWRAADLRGDLDLVAWDGDVLCFVEVKTRSARDQTPALLAIDQGKRRMLARMVRAYRRTLPKAKEAGMREEVLTRVDFVSVYLLAGGVECELVRDAFDWRAV